MSRLSVLWLWAAGCPYITPSRELERWDLDRDGFARPDDCDDEDPDRFPFNGEVCNGRDDDCDGWIDETMEHETFYVDADGDLLGDAEASVRSCLPFDGLVRNALDCDDTDPEVTTAPTWWRDLDRDGWGDPHDSIQSCTPPPDYVDRASDCDDSDPDTHPAAPEICDAVDNDCEPSTWGCEEDGGSDDDDDDEDGNNGNGHGHGNDDD